MTNYSQGHEAEQRAAEFLKTLGFVIRNLNWRTRVCEIDIIAEKANVIYFVEVKYRQTAKQGMGLDYITPKKLRQMGFAAEVWVQENGWNGAYELAAIELAGVAFTVTNFLPSIG
jgi:Holliday junction resolvase-like predicted endonuclease